MSESHIDVIKGRIEAACEESPIAVFDIGRSKESIFDAVFAQTVLTQNRIDQNVEGFIGEFYGEKGAEYFNYMARSL